jgi:hypothetical protein
MDEQRDLDENERLIAHYKQLCSFGDRPITKKHGRELMRIIVTLLERGFHTTKDGKDWIPPGTSDTG